MGLALLGAVVASACGEDWSDSFLDDRWHVEATVEPDAIVLEATVATPHGDDFTHISFRKVGWDNTYVPERSPAPEQPERDWSRVHRWFGELHRDTWLEGSLHDGAFEKPPADFRTYRYRLDRAPGARRNWPDLRGSKYRYITRGYGYADNHQGHPGFGAGIYEVELYAWYTGDADDLHPASGGEPEVQYVHFEYRVAVARFEVD
jgi:hypothetical protein